MTVDISLIPQERVQDLISTLDNIQNSLSNNLVHKSGTETISGEKTFTGDYLNIKNTTENIKLCLRKTSTTGQAIIVARDGDADNAWRSGIYFNNQNDSTGHSINFNTTSLNGPTPSASNSTSSTNIATVGWINDPTKSTNVLHRSGDEEINGTKTFTGTTKILTPTLTKQNTENEGGQIYFERSDGDVTMNDNNNHPYIDFWSGKFRFIGQSSSQTGSSVNIPFSVDIQNNCLCYGNSMKTMSFVIETYSSGTNWYRVWSDGFIEQGGTYSYTGTNAGFYTMTYNKAFTSTNYSIVGTGYRSDSSPWQGFCTFKDWTTTGCSVAFWDDTTSNPGVIKWYACGY